MRSRSRTVLGPLLLASLAVLGSAAACASSGGSEGGDPFRSDEPVVVAVVNRNFSDVLVFAESRAGQRRLGYVGGKSDRIFRVDPGFASDDLLIRVRELERARECTQHYPGAPGQVVRVTITETFERSQICF